MLKVKQVDLTTERYGDGYECTVTFQVGEHVYNTVKAKLTPEATRDVVELAVAKATAMLVVEHSEIRIAGEPLEEDAPKFAEVDEVVTDAIPAPQPEEAF